MQRDSQKYCILSKENTFILVELVGLANTKGFWKRLKRRFFVFVFVCFFCLFFIVCCCFFVCLFVLFVCLFLLLFVFVVVVCLFVCCFFFCLFVFWGFLLLFFLHFQAQHDILAKDCIITVMFSVEQHCVLAKD